MKSQAGLLRLLLLVSGGVGQNPEDAAAAVPSSGPERDGEAWARALTEHRQEKS